MKLNLNPLSAHKAAAENTINQRFEAGALKAAAYAEKRAQALAVIAGQAPTPDFAAAAAVEGISAAGFAAVVVSKPNLLMQLETRRRERILTIRAAASLEEINAVLASL